MRDTPTYLTAYALCLILFLIAPAAGIIMGILVGANHLHAWSTTAPRKKR